ncbi:PKD domain-containing protein [Ferruginibacter albus]|uniref:PKD domain-containing protein n=1 Tax=Ferruginibacter albus TaxID=2875540 RepID=UPI001CC82A44|nr:PKD domain-containing protein [Ferruginibacter albus]UAY53648.1 PKD domain-containing protein [Ferruginibacter albus]
MKRILVILLLLLSANSFAQLSSYGTDFWLGMGFNTRMKDPESPIMHLFLSAQQTATVRITLQFPAPAAGFPAPCNCKTVTVPAGQAIDVTNFPLGDLSDEFNEANLPDLRLYYTGISNRSIHVESLTGVPISAYEYSDGTDVGGATLLLPTDTWGSSYTVSTVGGYTNAGLSNSFFFVMAAEDNTVIDIVPSQDIVDSSNKTIFKDGTSAYVKYPKGVPFSITLNKGQVFNAMGAIVGTGSNKAYGVDLTGTTVKARICGKKITVFAGNGRVSLNIDPGCTPSSYSSSDNLIQQLFPKSAWGTKYLTVPTATGYNLFRINVQNAATKVWVNDPTHTNQLSGIIGNNYYELRTNQPALIESDQPIMVTEFMASGIAACNTTYPVGDVNGNSDAEMIILSPVQQAINSVSVYSPVLNNFTSSGNKPHHYVNVVIKKEGVASFKINGSSTFNGTAITSIFKSHPQEPNYSYAQFVDVIPSTSTTGKSNTFTSDSAFNAIAFGQAKGESYGYNAGTAVKDLSAITTTNNPYGSTDGAKTCKDNSSTYEVALPYLASQISSISWDTRFGDGSTNPNISPSNIYAGSITPIRTYVLNDQTYNVYASPKAYAFTRTGTLDTIHIVVSGTFSSECGSSLPIDLPVQVVRDTADFTFSNASCGSPTITFSDKTKASAASTIQKWIWQFGDGDSSIVQNPPAHTYATSSAFTTKLRVINALGCYSDTSKLIDFSAGLTAKFNVSPNDTVCAPATLTFTDGPSLPSGASGAINKWTWDFGDGNPVVDNNAPVSHNFSYTTPGKYFAKLTVATTAGCSSTYSDTIVVEASPVAAIDNSLTQACLGDSTSYTDKSTISVGAIGSWLWNFDDGGTSTLQNPKHKWLAAGIHTATLTVKSAGGCSSSNTATNTLSVFDLPEAGFKIDVNCVTNIITFTDTSNAKGGTITEWDWDFGDGAKLTTNNDSVIHHYYANGNGQTFTVNLTIKTQAGCSDDATPQSFSIGAAPVAQFSIAPGTYCLPNASVSFNNTSSISDGSTNNMSYIWNFGDVPAPGGDSVVAQGPPAAAAHIFTTQGPYTVTLTAVSNKGCTNSASVVVDGTIIHQPPVAGKFNPEPSLCFKDSLSLTRTFTGITISQYSWNMGDGTDLTGPTVKYAWKNPGVYPVTFVATSTDGCQSVPVVDSVTVNELPVAGFTAQATGLCPQTPVSFTDASTTQTGSAITQWFWNFGDGASQTVNAPNSGSVTHTYAASGTYSVSLSVKNSNGCSSTTYIGSVTINPLPYPNFTVTPICVPGADAQFTDKTTIASGAVIEWAWDFGDNTQSTQQNPTHPYPIGGTYPVKLNVTSALGCVHDTTISVTAYDTPTALDSIVNKGMLCSSAPVVLLNQSFVSGPNGNVSRIELFWDAANNSTTPDVTDNAPVANGRYTHDYGSFATDRNYTVTLKAYSGNGCPTTPYSQDITVLASPDARFDALAPVCQETTPFALSGGYDANNLGGTGAYSGLGVAQTDSVTYTFDPQVAGPGLDSPIVFTANYKGCTDTAQQAIFVYPTPSLDYGGVQSILEGDSATLNPVKVEGIGLSFNWDPSLYLDNDTIPTPLAKPIDDITYTITASSPAGCHGSTTLLVQVLKDFIVANTFTPNGDGVNDTWVIKELPKYPIHRVQVFNRYGQILMETHGYTKPWDGTMNGSQLPAGTYYYIIELNGLRTPKTGYVTILR